MACWTYWVTRRCIILITYARSSSLSNWSFCEQQYYINYVLGIERQAGLKAIKGTTVHKVLEVLANYKKVMQGITGSFDDDTYEYNDEQLGLLKWDGWDFLKPHILSNEEVDTINKTRINKSTYKDECKLKYGHLRYGVPLVEQLIKLSCNHYAKDWNPVDYRDVNNWVWMLLDFNQGQFDPRRRKIVAAEPHFDYVIDKDWAKYEWVLPNKKKTSGKLAIKGTIDLISEVEDGIIEITDYKCGQRIDWTSRVDNKIKTYKDFCQDFQLMLYYYATRRMYPSVKQIIVTIFYIRDGGPFTVCFDDKTLEETENRLRERFETIKTCQLPEMIDPTQTNFKCRYICDYYKMPSPDGKTNFCKFIHDKIEQVGIDEVTNKYMTKGFDIGNYEAPGEV